MAYRPSSAAAITIGCGVWKAPGLPDREVSITFDARLLSWYVWKAAVRPDLSYTVAMGKPAAKLTLK